MVQNELLKSVSSGLMTLSYKTQYDKSHQNGNAETFSVDG